MAKVLKTVAIVAVAVAVVVFAPQIAGVLASVAGSLGVTVAASAISSALIGMGISMALTAAATMFRKAPSMSQSLVDRLNTSVVPTASRKIVFGTTAAGQDVRFFEGDVDLPNSKKDGYVQVIALASHRISAFRDFYVENDLVWSNGTFLKHRGGFAPNNPFRVVTEGKPGNGFSVGSGRYWNSASTFTGCAYYVPFWKLDEEVWESGIPQRLTAIVDGCPLYDPRRDSTRGGSGSHRAGNHDTYAFRDGAVELGRNPALALLTYLLGWRINGKLVWGMGIPAHRIDFDNFRTYANLCEERVATQGGGTVQRYTVDGIFSTTDSHETIINGVTAAMGSCKLTDRGGTYCLVGGYDDTAGPKISFTADDLVAPANGSSPYIWNPAPPSRERYNIVRGRFANPDELYQLADWGDPIEQPPLADGIPRTLSIDLGAVSRAETCQRIAKQFLLREYLTPGMFSATFGPKAFAVEIGSVITLSLPAEGWNNKLFRVMEQAETHDLFFQMTLREEDPQVYAWDREEKPLPISIRPQGYDASATISPANLTLTSDSYSGANAVNVSEVHVAWTPELSGRVSGIQIQSRPQGTDAWTEQAALFDPKLGTFTFTSNAPGITVEVQARFRMSSAVYSPWVMASVKTAEVITVTDWKNVTDNAGTRPDDNATKGATAGTDLKDSAGGVLTDDRIITEKGISADTKKVNGVDAVDITKKLASLEGGGFADTTPPVIPSGLILDSALTDAGSTLKASWNSVGDSDLAGYIIAIREGSGNYIEFLTGSPSYERTGMPRGTNYTAKVAAYDKAGNRSGFSAEVSLTTARDTTPPGLFTIDKVEATYESAFVTVTAPTDNDIDRLRLDLYSGNALVGQQTVKVSPGQKTTVTLPKLSKATTYQVGGYSFDTSDNASVSGVASVQFTTAGGVSAADIAPDAALIQTVNSLPNLATWAGSKVVLFNGELYRIVAGAWSKSVAYADVTSKPTSLASINVTEANKLSGIKEGAGSIIDTRDIDQPPSYYYAKGMGQYQEFKNGSFSGSASSSFGNLVTTVQWPDPSGGPVKQVLTDSLNVIYERASTSTGAWGAWGKNYNSVSKPKLGSDLLTSTGAVLTDTNTLNSNQTWGEVSGPNRPADNATVGAPSGTYVGDTLAQTVAANSNNPAAQINRNTVTIDGGKITAGTVDTAQLKAGSVKTAQLVIGSMSELNPDPGFRDTSFWVNNGVHNGALGTSAGSIGGWYNSHGPDINQLLGTTHYCMLWEAYFKGAGRQHLISGRRGNIKANGVYEFSAVMRNASNQRIVALCRMFDVNGDFLADATLSVAAGEWDIKRIQFNAPLGVNSYCFYVYNDAGIDFLGNCQVAALQVVEASASTAIQNGAITTDKLIAGAVTAGKLSVNARQISAAELNVRYKDGVLSWNAGNIVYVTDAGNAAFNSVPAGSVSGAGYLVYKPGNPSLEYVGDYAIRANTSYFTIAFYDGFSTLTIVGGTSTVLNGGNIQTGTVHADKIVSKSIGTGQLAAGAVTANEIQAGTIGAAQIATNALTARVIAAGNPDSIIGDSDFRDASWWNSGVADGRLRVGETGMSEGRRELLIEPGGGIDVFSMWFPAEPGATYRISYGVYTYPEFRGSFRPMIHVPGIIWMSLKESGLGMDPSDQNPFHNYTEAGSYYRNSFVYTNPGAAGQGQWQFRLGGSWTGACSFTVKIVRVSDTTLIKDGSITTDKITVGTLNGDRIATETLDANKLKANSITTGQLSVGLQSRTINNIINAPFWGTADMNATPYWSPNQAGSNSWFVGQSPAGGAEPLLRMQAITNDANGGWNTTVTEADGWSRNKAYRYYTWFWNESGDNSFFHGTDNVQQLGGGDIANPYFFSSPKSSLQTGRWYLFVGVVHPAGSVQADSGMSGVWDPVTGRRIIAGGDYRWRPNATYAVFRSYQFYGAVGGVGYYTKPVAEEIVAGQTPSIRSLMQQLDYAQNINGGSTLIAPGKILVQGGTTMDSWRDGTEIRGGAIKANSIASEKLTIASRAISFIGIDFEWKPSTGWVHWSEGYIYYITDAGNEVGEYIPAGNSGGTPPHLWFYWFPGAGRLHFNQANPARAGIITLASWWGGTSLNVTYGGTVVNGNKITTGTIAADKISVGSLSAISANVGTVTAGLVRSTSGNAYFDLDNARIVFNNGSVMKVQGVGFGSANQFIEWFGPVQNNFANCTEANATYYLKTNGSAYFGGALSAGTLKNSVQTTSLAADANVTTGTFGSNGRQRIVTVSYNMSGNTSITGGCPAPYTPYATIRLYRGTNAGGQLLAEQRIDGSHQCSPGQGQYEPGYYSDNIGGSITYTDNSGGGQASYFVQIVARNTGVLNAQSLGVTSVEQ